jgi:hypothetical protein
MSLVKAFFNTLKSIVCGAPSWSEHYGMQIAFDGGSAHRVQEE